MRYLILIFTVVSLNGFAQEQTDNLHAHVQKLMKKEFKFECDMSCEKKVSATTDKKQKSEHQKGIICHAQSTPVNHPLIILGGEPVKIDTLKSYTVAQVKSIETLEGKDATVLYGQMASKGVILIELSE